MASSAVRLALVALAWASAAIGAEETKSAQLAQAKAEWPQWRGLNRDGVVSNSPKLLDIWPKEGPKQIWQSEYIPSYMSGGGCASPVVADGKVFLYVNWKQPKGGGTKVKLINTERLIDVGWLPDIPDVLARKIEAARVAPSRPSASGFPEWYNFEIPKDTEITAFLAKHVELNKYTNDFIATLSPNDAKTYGDYIKRRFSMHVAGPEKAYTWDDLAKLSKCRDLAFETEHEWRNKVSELNINLYYGNRPFDFFQSWVKACTVYDTVICLDAKTGSTLWKKDFPVDLDSIRKNDFFTFSVIGVSATPAVANGKCFAQGESGLYCLSTKDGGLVWQVKTPPTHTSPLLANGIVYNYGCAYNADTGKLLWKREVNNKSHVSASLWRADGRFYVIGTDNSDQWSCVDLETGKVLWEKLDRISSNYGCTSAVVAGDILVSQFTGEGLRAYKLTNSGAALLWKRPANRSEPSAAYTVWQKCLYVFADIKEGTTWLCLDLNTGETKWKGDDYAADGHVGGVFASPLVADGKLFNTIGAVHNDRNDHEDVNSLEMVSAAPDGKYQRLGKFSPRICLMTSPALANGRLYLRLEKGVACYDLTQH